MNVLPSPIQDAIESLSCLPGIGKRSAERLVLALLQNKSSLDQKIAQSIGSLKSSIRECDFCAHYAEDHICGICSDSRRRSDQICIVESPLDVVALERCHEYKGRYVVLHGVLSPLNKIRPDDLRIDVLLNRLQTDPPQEIIFALPSTTEGEATSLFLMERIESLFSGTITRLSRGIPSGGDLDYLDIGTIGRALLDRRPFV